MVNFSGSKIAYQLARCELMSRNMCSFFAKL